MGFLVGGRVPSLAEIHGEARPWDRFFWKMVYAAEFPRYSISVSGGRGTGPDRRWRCAQSGDPVGPALGGEPSRIGAGWGTRCGDPVGLELAVNGNARVSVDQPRLMRGLLEFLVLDADA